MWFHQLFGIDEGPWAWTQQQFRCEGETLTSLANGRQFAIGRFDTPTLQDLRDDTADAPRGALRWRHEVIGDVLGLHSQPQHAGAMFQVASQFNCLEFVGPDRVPEDGVSDYAYDPTQGPACALAAAAATVYRNYLVPMGAATGHAQVGTGQTRDRQLDNLRSLSAALGEPLFAVRNGYTSATPAQLARLAEILQSADREALLGAVRIGVQSQVGVTFASRWREPPTQQVVSQAFCSAVSCAYVRDVPQAAWAPLARLALDAAYEATLRAAARDLWAGRGSGVVWLTALGGGAFGNDKAWIAGGLGRALRTCRALPLDVRIGHYRQLDSGFATAVDRAATT